MMEKKKQPKPVSSPDPKDPRPSEPERRYPDQDPAPARRPGVDEETGVPVER